MKPIIKVENLSKQYSLGAKQLPYSTLRESLVQTASAPLRVFRRNNGDNGGGKNRFWALKGVNFEVMPGEVVGVIGRNGAGKSTLLKVLSRITEPTNGKIELYGRVGSLLEVGTGFHPELTGRENIFLNGAILGMKREEIAKKFDEIVDFAEIQAFLDTPVKHYSSGMYTRLAFAVAANLEPEILIVDEVLAVGDAEFQKKCLGKMKSVSDKEGRTVLFVSHNMSAVKSICRRGIMLKQGTVEYDGDSISAVDFYMQGGSDLQSSRDWSNSGEMPGNENIKIKRAAVRAAQKSADEPILTSDDLVFEIEFYNGKNNAEIDVTWDLINIQGIHVAHIGTVCSANGLPRGWHKTTGILSGNILNTERYIFGVRFGRNQRELLFKMEDILTFNVEDGFRAGGSNFNKFPGVIHPKCQWMTVSAENEEPAATFKQYTNDWENIRDMSAADPARFQNLDFAGFKELAKDNSLSPHEKIGFPDSYRAGKEAIIFNDIKRKLPNLSKDKQVVVDIGAGCGAFAFLFIEHCLKRDQTLVLIDSEEMLANLPDEKGLVKIPAYYPNDCQNFLEEYANRVDVALSYSVLHYVFDEGNLFHFLDATLGLLAVGGECLIGDIPNISKRKRFFASPTGINFHQEFMNTTEKPVVEFNKIETGQIDDSALISLMQRARSFGFDAYILPQSEELPMSNRREDFFIKKP